MRDVTVMSHELIFVPFFNRIVVFPCKWKRREKMQLTLEASKEKEFTRSLVGRGESIGPTPSTFDTIHPIAMKITSFICTFN